GLEHLGEVLPQQVAGAELQGLAVAHHALEGEAGVAARELLPLGLASRIRGEGGDVHGEVLVDLAEYAEGVPACVVLGGVAGVALLPQELRRAQEEAGPELPAHDVGP